ncbi:hypothetical protein [Thalassotalea euphylliae]|uniref:Uncharacterized protein n=1 Tax=Thalassotalea euphylliae TaxID=1655234 RepID=A0A3E0U206_9GAMM|nr:hypothetical protein [Thalassotalea euphylliae]REL30958.1 hypothetical protein DXX94_09625 [Thalassotalea euphylliae]
MNTLINSAVCALLATTLLAPIAAYAEPSTNHGSEASKHSALALSHGAAGSAQVASAVVAVPLLVGGSVAVSAGVASVELAEGMSDAATSSARSVKHHHPVELEVTEITITVDRSPTEAMKKQ